MSSPKLTNSHKMGMIPARGITYELDKWKKEDNFPESSRKLLKKAPRTKSIS